MPLSPPNETLIDAYAYNANRYQSFAMGPIGTGKRRLLMTDQVSEHVLFTFDEVHHCAGDRLLAFERSDSRAFSECHAALINVGHLRSLYSFVSTLVIDDDQTFVADYLVFVQNFLGPGEISFWVNVFDVDRLRLRCDATHCCGANGAEDHDAPVDAAFIRS